MTTKERSVAKRITEIFWGRMRKPAQKNAARAKWQVSSVRVAQNRARLGEMGSSSKARLAHQMRRAASQSHVNLEMLICGCPETNEWNT